MHGLIIHTREIHGRAAELERGICATQESDTQTRATFRGVVLHARVDLVISQAAEHPRVCSKARKTIETCIQRIAGAGDEIAGDQRDMRFRLIGQVHCLVQLASRQERAHVDIA